MKLKLTQEQKEHVAYWIESHEIQVPIEKLFIKEGPFQRPLTKNEYVNLFINKLCDDIRNQED